MGGAIADVKSAIAAAKGHSVGQQRLLFESEEPLEDTQLLQPLFANKQRRLLYLVLVPVDDVSVLLELNSTKQLDGREYNKLRKGMTIEQVAELNLRGVTIRDGRVVLLDLSKPALGIRTLPKEIGELSALQDFFLAGCESLEALPKEIGELSALQTLNFHEC